MKFEEILPLVKKGKKAHSKIDNEDYYLSVENGMLQWFGKKSKEFFFL